MEKLVIGCEGVGIEDMFWFERLYNIVCDCVDLRMDIVCFKC